MLDVVEGLWEELEGEEALEDAEGAVVSQRPLNSLIT